jgi:GDPmannose 4,6-dehydratase
MPKRAFITGITGQDAAYLAKFLLEKDYEVYGAYRRSASVNLWRLHDLQLDGKVKLVPMDLLELTNIMRTIQEIAPDEIYNLGAQSFVGISFDQLIYTTNVNAVGVAYLLESVRTIRPEARFYQASTSEMFGKVQEVPQNEKTPFYPRSPYAVAKLYGHWITVNYREAHGMHASSGILFNHESPLRGREFVTRKITASLAKIKHGQQEVLELGNLDAKRDWGFAGDYVEGMWLMLQQPTADDYVLATGESRSVREFVEAAAAHLGFQIAWEGEGADTKGIDRKTGAVIVRVNPAFYRPAEVDYLLGDSTKARTKLGWTPKVAFEELVEMMVKADMDRAARGELEHLNF